MGVLFGIAVMVLTTLAGPLLLFNPWFTSVLQERHGVAETFDVGRTEVDRVTGELLGDLWTDGDFEASFAGGEPLLDERERSHMRDVSTLVRILGGVTIVAAALAGVCAVILRGERARVGRILLVAGGMVGVVAIMLAGTFAVAFEPAFLAFHELFFPSGTYLFEPGSNLITLFPEGFWFDAALAAGAAVIVVSLIVSLAGLNRWRGGPATARPQP